MKSNIFAGFIRVIAAWGDGVYGIVAIAMQMILILVKGVSHDRSFLGFARVAAFRHGYPNDPDKDL
ncbi:MAG: TIGR00366 family protein [Syntrophales bacterium]|nr:TIGR00366 family protein [Syntrophales bacterium]